MKFLLLNRHANSPWKGQSVSDHDRELDEVGFDEADLMGKRLLDKGVSFDSMVTSSALRALTTCQLIASNIKFDIERIDINKNIYGANCEDLMKIIRKTDDSIDSLAIFGHNPTLHILSESIYGQAISSFPPCSMIYIRFDSINWDSCFDCDKKTIFFDYPSNV